MHLFPLFHILQQYISTTKIMSLFITLDLFVALFELFSKKFKIFLLY